MILIPIAEGKNTFTQYVHLAEEGETVKICRHGKPVAVISSIQEFENVHKDSGFLNNLQEDRKIIEKGADSGWKDSFFDEVFLKLRTE